MCELLIVAQDQTSTDLYLDCKRYKTGDVVIVAEDGAVWGKEELFNPMFRILQLPNVGSVSAEPLLSWETPSSPGIDPGAPTNTCQRRGFHLDITTLPQDVQDWFADATRAQPTFLTLELTDQDQTTTTTTTTTTGTQTTDTGTGGATTSPSTTAFSPCIAQKAAVADPKTVGASSAVIG